MNGAPQCYQDDSGVFESLYSCKIRGENGADPTICNTIPFEKLHYECNHDNYTCSVTDYPGSDDSQYDSMDECNDSCNKPPLPTICTGHYSDCGVNCRQEWIFDKPENAPKCPKHPDKACNSGSGQCEKKTKYKCNGDTGTCSLGRIGTGPTNASCISSCEKCSSIDQKKDCTNYAGESNCYWCDLTNKCIVSDKGIIDNECTSVIPAGTNFKDIEPTKCNSNEDCIDGACDISTKHCVYSCDKNKTCNYLDSDITRTAFSKWETPKTFDSTTCVNNLSTGKSMCPLGQISCSANPECKNRLCDPMYEDCSKVNDSDVSSFTCDSNKCPWIGYEKDQNCNIDSSNNTNTTWCCN